MVTIDDDILLVAIRHSMRREILKLLAEHGHQALSPSALAEMLNQELGNVSYHVREMAKSGVIVLVDTKPVNGSLQHFYLAHPVILETPWVRETIGLSRQPE